MKTNRIHVRLEYTYGPKSCPANIVFYLPRVNPRRSLRVAIQEEILDLGIDLNPWSMRVGIIGKPMHDFREYNQ